jgi:hypothetical protein
MVAHQTVVLQSRVRILCLPSPQLTANLLVGCHLGMELGCGLTSVRGNRGEKYVNELLVRQKHKKKKKIFRLSAINISTTTLAIAISATSINTTTIAYGTAIALLALVLSIASACTGTSAFA